MPSQTFDEFCDDFYGLNSNRNLYEFTLNLASDNNNFHTVYSILCNYNYNIYRSSSENHGGGSSGKDANYILHNSNDCYSTPSSYFERPPLYSSFDYSSLISGDIIWETETIFFNAGHCALITFVNQQSDYGNYIQTIEAVGGGVQRGFLDDLRMTYYKCKILRTVDSSAGQINDALYFANEQVNKRYSLNILRLNTSIDSKEWYCSELIYASWLFAGIDIGVRNGQYLTKGCLPSDIGQSDNTFLLPATFYAPLSFNIKDKLLDTWKITISNNGNEIINVFYNKKMCFYDDAKNRSNLYDLNDEAIVLYPNDYITVNIQENFFATTIVASYCLNNYRFISYADNLNEQTHDLTSYLSILVVKKDA